MLGVKAKGRAAMACGSDPFSVETYFRAPRCLPSGDKTGVRFRIKPVLRNNEPYMSFNLKELGNFEVFGLGSHIAIDASFLL